MEATWLIDFLFMSVSLLSPFGLHAFGYFPNSGMHSLNRHSQNSFISSLICEVAAIMIGQASSC